MLRKHFSLFYSDGEFKLEEIHEFKSDDLEFNLTVNGVKCIHGQYM